MYRYLKSNSHVTLVFQAEKNSNKSRSMGSCKICYKLLRKQCVLIVWAGRPDGKYLAHGDNLRTSLRLVHTAWPAEPNIFPSDLTLPVDTRLSVRLPPFSFFLSSYIFSSSHLAGTYAGLCDFSRPCSCHYVHFLYRDFFIRIRISKTHRCLLPVCKNTRVEDHHDVNQAYGY